MSFVESFTAYIYNYSDGSNDLTEQVFYDNAGKLMRKNILEKGDHVFQCTTFDNKCKKKHTCFSDAAWILNPSMGQVYSRSFIPGRKNCSVILFFCFVM